MGINLRLLCRKEHKTVAIFGRKVMNNRITILGIVVLFLLSLDVARIFYLQVLKGDEYAAKAESQQLSDTGGKGSSAHSHFREEANSENQKRV